MLASAVAAAHVALLICCHRCCHVVVFVVRVRVSVANVSSLSYAALCYDVNECASWPCTSANYYVQPHYSRSTAVHCCDYSSPANITCCIRTLLFSVSIAFSAVCFELFVISEWRQKCVQILGAALWGSEAMESCRLVLCDTLLTLCKVGEILRARQDA